MDSVAAQGHEPLGILARFAYDFAPHLCDPAHGCTDYHRGWSLLRHHEAQGALPLGLAFFRRELGALAERLGQDRLRILISGAADTGQAAMLVEALRPLGIAPEFVAVDLCATPLMQQRLFLAMAGIPAEFHQADAVTVEVAPVDAVVSHSFIGFVPVPRREALVANWARLMRPGGRLVLSERLAPRSALMPAWPDPGEREARRAALARRLADADLSEGDRQGMLRAADRLWDMTGQRVRMGLPEFRAALDAAGLRLLSLEERAGGDSVSPIAARATAANRPRHEAVAEKP
jgi:SAM-dependent methyltransferase